MGRRYPVFPMPPTAKPRKSADILCFKPGANFLADVRPLLARPAEAIGTMLGVIGASVALRRSVKRATGLVFVAARKIEKNAVEQQAGLGECTRIITLNDPALVTAADILTRRIVTYVPRQARVV